MSGVQSDVSRGGATPGVAAFVAAWQSGWRALPLAALVVALDQWTKALIETHYELYESTRLLPVLDIARWHNTGAAFSFLAGAGGWQRWFFTLLAIVVSVVMVLWMRRIVHREERWLTFGLAAIVGGALGNAIDRLQHGYVVDFIVAHWGNAYFPAFNVADSSITLGAALLLVDAFFTRHRSSP